MKRVTVQKFLANTCTPKEAEQVIDWLATSEGQKYLEEELSYDIEEINEDQSASLNPALNSARLYGRIQRKIGRKARKGGKRQQKLKYFFRMAAAAVILSVVYVGYFYINNPAHDKKEAPEKAPIIQATGPHQQQKLTLSDGTTIRLNSNSQIQINPGYAAGERSVTLHGEAYFSVTHNPKNPFIVHTGQSNVKVLGTKFNVRARSGDGNVQVAVVEGLVSFESNSPQANEYSVYLEKGQFGILNNQTNLIKTDAFGISNYLSWIDGRLQFDKATFSEVCTQLERLYNIECHFGTSSIKQLNLTADFSAESLSKTLEVIALSLDLKYQKTGIEVTWMYMNDRDL